PLGDLPRDGDLLDGAQHQLPRRRTARRSRPPQSPRIARPSIRVSARDLCFTSATDLARLYRARKTSPLEVMEAVFARIDAINPALNAYVTLARESALEEARRATAALKRRAQLPSLHRVPLSIKDLTPTKGIRTTNGPT